MMKNDELKDEETIEENTSKKILLSIILITILVISVISLSFATFQKGNFNDNSNSISTGNISMNYTEDTNGISITNAMPISDEVGKSLKGVGEYFDFTINSTIVNNAKLTYQIAAVKDTKSTVPDSDIKIYLEQQKSGTYESVMDPTPFTPISETSDMGAPKGSMILRTVNKNSSGSDNYRLRMWINEKASPSQGLTYTVKVNVYGKAS